MKQKKLLSLGLALTMSLSVTAPAWAGEEEDDGIVPISLNPYTVPEDAKDSVVILHSNDVHGAIEGYAKMAALKAMYEEAGAYVFVMDAGDFIQGDTSVSVSQGATAVELMNMVGYQVAAPGNHEFDYGYENLKQLQTEADFPILAANLSAPDGSFLLGHSDRLILTTENGTKIGVFGLDTPETASKAHPGKLGGVIFTSGENMYDIAQSYTTLLREEGADYVVCLGHLGIDEETAATSNRSIDLLDKVTGIDVFLDGHSHSTEEDIVAATNENRTVNGTVLTSTGTKFANIGVVTIKEDGEITTECVDTALIPVPEDSPIAARAAEIRAEIEDDYGQVFATTEVRLNGDRDPGNRTEETNLGDLITDALLWKANAQGETVDIAITNGGGIRATIEAGDITKKVVNTVLPFGNTLNIIHIKGSELLEVLEASTFCTPTAVGGFPQVSGITFTVDTTAEYDQGEVYGESTYFAPASINRVTIDTINGEPFNPETVYSVVTNDFMAAGGDTYYRFVNATANYDLGIPMDEVVMEYIQKELDGAVTAADYGTPKGRITVLTGSKYPVDMDDPQVWWYDAAVFCLDNGVMQGTDNGFDAESTLTRAQVFQTLYNLSKDKTEATVTVAVPEELNWAQDALNWAATVGLFKAREYVEDEVITRAETAQTMANFCALNDLEAASSGEADVTLSSDFADVSEEHQDGVTYCFDAGIMVGNENGELMPAKSLTRAEWAMIMVNLEAFTTKAAQATPVA